MKISIQDSMQNTTRNTGGDISDTGSNNEIRIIQPADFPALLKQVKDKPKRLFMRGNFPVTEKYLCVVGARRTSQYGVDACRKLIRGLRGYNITIVSGLAIGIDAIAHEAALEAELPTVAILGSGVDWDAVYPRSNLKLAKEIVAAGGALISESPPSYKPHEFNFPQRNRIMAGLSHAALIVEASLKSGTLITARLAGEHYNRDIFAVPGSIFSEHSAGSNMLIANGALLIEKSEDIVAGLGLKSLHDSSTDPTRLLTDCTPTEIAIYKALTEPLSRPQLLEKLLRSRTETRDAIVAISLLEMKGFITETNGAIRRL